MSYAIIRIQKFKRGAVKGIQIHDRREKDVSHTNPDIDRTKSSQNYTLEGGMADDYLREIDERVGKLHHRKAVRKDAVVMCQALITSDAAFFKSLPTRQQQKQFFQHALSFIKRRYGDDNIVSATVHLDERTPHMHVNFTPIRDGKLSAYSILTRQELTALQTDFHEQVGMMWGLERGEKHNVKRRHLDVADYKRATDVQLDRMSISPEEVVPAVLEKGGFFSKSVVESPEMIAERLNRKYVWPLARSLQEVQKDEKTWHFRANMREALFREQQQLQEYLSPERQERLKQGIKALSDELKREQQEEREMLRTRKQTRYRGR